MSRASLARRSLIVLAALILLFEEWIWNAMLRATARLVAHPWIQAAEQRLAKLEPVEALCAFVLPALTMLPFKFAAIYVLARGYLVTGIAVLMLAKVVSTTLGARIYVVVRPQLQQVGWYARLESRFLTWKRRIVEALRATPTWQALQAHLAAWRVQRHGLLRRGWRRLVAALRLLRRHRTVNPPR
ncbi:hypothetical protein [Ralstonia solanacearum]|uniref:hypothetical protein n=1 Tax=Ralstonia solanacearum TaxID=305 RepID=UPI0012A399F1|nr:hypothetical protein [Ralstonia solanacearum]AYB51460.2 hypothetical protein C2I38_08190 [Ralstonia solanacearum]AYB56016.1 hypothetical protein C2L97_08190 [Ralstonia solanacearum]